MNERLKKDVNRLLYANLWPIIICKFLCCKYAKACNISSKVQDLVGLIKLKINITQINFCVKNKKVVRQKRDIFIFADDCEKRKLINLKINPIR